MPAQVINAKARRGPTAPRVKMQERQVTTVARRSDLPGSDSNIDLHSIGGRITYARLRENVTQDDLARAIDRVRGTIGSYEKNIIEPPINVVNVLAKVLKVSPSFLAFGEHGVKVAAGSNAAEATISVDEITFGRDGDYVSGTFAMPRALAQTYVENVRDLKVYVLAHNADVFGFRQGTRLFMDTSIGKLSSEFDTYVIKVAGGMDVIRISPSLSSTTMVTVETSRGAKQEVSADSLNIMGAVVSTLRPHH